MDEVSEAVWRSSGRPGGFLLGSSFTLGPLARLIFCLTRPMIEPLAPRAQRVCALALLVGCIEYPDYEPLGEGASSPVSSGSPLDDEAGGTDSDMAAGCDPFADPTDECGAGNTCDPETGACRAAIGTTALGEICSNEGLADECAPGLICREGRCRQPCDPSAELSDPDATGICPASDACIVCPAKGVCTSDDLDWGICLARCSLLEQDCALSGEACNRAQGVDDEFAACTRNLGLGTASQACASDGDCLAGYLCTPESQHEEPCADLAESCCAPICDIDLAPCVGLDLCYVLGILGQETAGYCGS